jgi:hypothetical protein
MFVDVAAYHGFCLFALGVSIRVIVRDGMWLPCGHKLVCENTWIIEMRGATIKLTFNNCLKRLKICGSGDRKFSLTSSSTVQCT